MMILLAIIYLVLLFTVTEITIFITLAVLAIYFWQISLILFGIVLCLFLVYWIFVGINKSLREIMPYSEDPTKVHPIMLAISVVLIVVILKILMKQ